MCRAAAGRKAVAAGSRPANPSHLVEYKPARFMPQTEQMKKVLFVRFSAYGDILMCAPALQHYIHTHPQDEVHVLVSPHYAEVLRNLRGIHQFHYYAPQRNWRGLDEYLKCAIEHSI